MLAFLTERGLSQHMPKYPAALTTDKLVARCLRLQVENYRLRETLARCLPILQADAQMMADVSRFASLDHASQAAHDTTEYESERLAREIPVLLGLPNAKVSRDHGDVAS